MITLSETWIIGKREREAFRLLGESTRGTFDFWHLAGPASAKKRQAIASALDGRKVPVAKCGVNALRAAFHGIADINGRLAGDCIAARDASFSAYAREIVERAS